MRGRIALFLIVCLAVAAHADDREIKDLVDELGDPDEHVRLVAVRELSRIGAPAVPALIDCLSDESALRRRHAAEVLGQLGSDARSALPKLRELVRDPDARVRAAATVALRAIEAEKLGPAPPLPVLREALKSPDATTRRRAVESIGELGEAALGALPDLTGLLLGDPDPGVRLAAAEALGRIGDGAAAEPLLRFGASADWRFRWAAHDALVRIGPKALRPLLAAVRDPDAPVRSWAPGVFHALPAETLPVALEALDHPDKRTRAAAADAIGWLGSAAVTAIPSLVLSLDDPAGAVRRRAALALGSMGAHAEPALPPLVALARDERRRARLQAVRAIAMILTDLARPVLPKRGQSSSQVDQAIERGLAWIRASQEADGGWLSKEHGGQVEHAVGVSGLALLALLTGGVGDADVAAASAGLRRLLSVRHQDGTWTSGGKYNAYAHAICTRAMILGYGQTGNPLWRSAAQRGLDLIAAARNPDLAWRYGFRDGQNDTSVTGWMLGTLDAGRWAGLTVDRDAFPGALAWVDRMTAPETGRVGYFEGMIGSARTEEAKGRFPPEKSRAMTAAGLLIRLEAGQTERDDAVAAAAAECMRFPPVWDVEGGRLDMYAWLMGTRAMRRLGGSDWLKWAKALARAAVPAQRGEDAGEDAGSWDPVGPWGANGGRVYSTSVAVLCLKLAAGRGSPIGRSLVRNSTTQPALQALKLALADADPALREAAAQGVSAVSR